MNPTLYGWSPSGALPEGRLRVYQVLFSTIGVAPDTVAFADGVSGPATTAALRAYQTQKRLPVTGTFDANTVALLDADVDSLTRQGRPIVATAQEIARASAPRPASRVTGTHPPVTNIVSQGGVVAVPAKVSQMISPAVESQLKAMPAAQVQSFVADLSTKADMAESTGTGKASIDAVPVVSPNGTVTAATAITQATGWAALSTTEQVAVGVGAVAVTGLLIYLVARK